MTKFIDLLHQLPSNILHLSHCPLQKRSSHLSRISVWTCVLGGVLRQALSFVADKDGLSGDLTIPAAVFVNVTKYLKSEKQWVWFSNGFFQKGNSIRDLSVCDGGAAAPPEFGHFRFFGQQEKFGQGRFLKKFACVCECFFFGERYFLF